MVGDVLPRGRRRRRTSARLVAAGVEVFKVHVQVGEFDLDDPLLDPVWGLLADAGTPVVVHAGSGPVGNDFTGPGVDASGCCAGTRGCALVIAHLGAPEYAEFLALAERLRAGRTSTRRWSFTDFFGRWRRTRAELLPRLRDLRRPGAARQRLPDDPLPLRPPARGARAPRPRRRLAAGGLLGQRRPPLRSLTSFTRPGPRPGEQGPSTLQSGVDAEWTETVLETDVRPDQAAPAAGAAVLADGMPGPAALSVVIACRLVEGTALGVAQSTVLARVAPALARVRNPAATPVVAGLGGRGDGSDLDRSNHASRRSRRSG